MATTCSSEFTAAFLRLFVQLYIQPWNLARLKLIFQQASDFAFWENGYNYDYNIVDFDRTSSVLERISLVLSVT